MKESKISAKVDSQGCGCLNHKQEHVGIEQKHEKSHQCKNQQDHGHRGCGCRCQHEG